MQIWQIVSCAYFPQTINFTITYKVYNTIILFLSLSLSLSLSRSLLLCVYLSLPLTYHSYNKQCSHILSAQTLSDIHRYKHHSYNVQRTAEDFGKLGRVLD